MWQADRKRWLADRLEGVMKEAGECGLVLKSGEAWALLGNPGRMWKVLVCMWQRDCKRRLADRLEGVMKEAGECGLVVKCGEVWK